MEAEDQYYDKDLRKVIPTPRPISKTALLVFSFIKIHQNVLAHPETFQLTSKGSIDTMLKSIDPDLILNLRDHCLFATN